MSLIFAASSRRTRIRTAPGRSATALVLAGALTSVIGFGAGASETPLNTSDDQFSDADVQRRGLAFEGARLWDHGVIPVWIDANLGRSTVSAARAAMNVWNTVAGITFVEVTSGSPPSYDHVHLQPGEGCASWVGRRGGGQALWASPECNSGTLIHELGHVIGLEHEHTRVDRDAWIRINTENVRADKLHNFDVAPAGSRLLGEYDYASIMHYGPDYFSIDGSPTIEPLRVGAVIGQRIAPSDGDIAAVAELYGTDMAVDAKLFRVGVSDQQSTVHDIEVIVSNDGPNGSHGIELDLSLPGPWSVLPRATSLDEWTCSPLAQAKIALGEFVSLRCRLDKLAPGVQSALTLAVTHSGPEASTIGLSESLHAGQPRLALRATTDDLNIGNNKDVISDVERVDTGVERVSGAGSASSGPLDDINRYSEAEADKDADILLQDAVATGDVLVGGGSALNPGWALLSLMLMIRRRRRRQMTVSKATATVPDCRR